MLTNYTVGKFMSDKITQNSIYKNIWDGGMICASLRWANINITLLNILHLLICAVQSKGKFYFISSQINWKL